MNVLTEATAPRVTDGDGARIMRRVTLHVIPFLLACYFISFLDRINVAFAALQMNKDLGFSPSIYGLGSGLFFITYCLMEVPSNRMLIRVGASAWIARIMVTWGVCAAATAFVVGPYSFYAMRLLLGAAEAGFFPGVLFFLTLWFPEAYRGRIIGMFMAGVAISGIIGAPLSGLLLSMDGLAGLRGWQWLFILEGAPAIALAPLCLVLLKDSPVQANWLTAGDRDWLTRTLASEHRRDDPRHGGMYWRVVWDPRVLLLSLMYFTNVCLLNGILFFLPLIVKGFGLTNTQTGFVAAIPSVCALVAVIWWGRQSDRMGNAPLAAGIANGLAGLALLASVLVADPVTRIVCISISFAATLAVTAPFWSIPPALLTGPARAAGYAAISSLGVLGGFFAPTIIGFLKDVTGDFRVGLGIVAIAAILGAVALNTLGGRMMRDAQAAAH
jgi:MFS family permease